MGVTIKNVSTNDGESNICVDGLNINIRNVDNFQVITITKIYKYKFLPFSKSKNTAVVKFHKEDKSFPPEIYNDITEKDNR